jgi:hypothetical protein
MEFGVIDCLLNIVNIILEYLFRNNLHLPGILIIREHALLLRFFQLNRALQSSEASAAAGIYGLDHRHRGTPRFAVGAVPSKGMRTEALQGHTVLFDHLEHPQ